MENITSRKTLIEFVQDPKKSFGKKISIDATPIVRWQSPPPKRERRKKETKLGDGDWEQ